MENNWTDKEREIQRLQNRVHELEQQLAKAQAGVRLSTSPQEAEPGNRIANEERFQRAILTAPYPLMIRRDDGKVVMLNTAWTEITGYALEDIPTIEEWTRKAYAERGPQTRSLILNEGFSQTAIKKWGEFEVTTRSGEKRIWDFSTAPLGMDEMGRELVMTMAVDITERKQTEEKLRTARDEAAWLARFPMENPNPVMRVSKTGIILYCNAPAARLRGWRCETQSTLSSPLLDLVELAITQGQVVEQDVLLGEKFYSVAVIPILEEGYLNLYGRDITERKQAEKALAESERRQREITRLLELDQARLAAILRHLPVGVWIMDQQGRLTGNNPEADRIWAGEAPLLNSIDEFQKYVSWHPESGEILKPEEYPVAVALRTGEPVEPIELDIRRFDGSQGTVLASAVPIKDNRSQLMGVVAVYVDITERKQAQEHINDLLAFNEKILNYSPVGILTYKVTGQCVFANEKVASIVGIPVADLLRQNFHTIASWKKSGLYDLVQQAISTQTPTTADIHHVSTFGKDVWITAHCITFHSKGEEHVLLSLSDITERKKAEELLRKSEERFAKAFHASPNAMIISRLSDGLIMEVNEGWSTIFGHKPDEVLGRTTLEVGVYVNSEDRQKAIAHLQENGFLRDLEVQICRKSGETREASISGERIEINGVECLLAIIQDITERKQAEAALRESEHRLKRAQEIAHLGSWELDLVDNRLTWSDEVYRIFGLEPQEFGATYEAFLEAVHPDDRAAVDHAYSSSIREGRDSYEIEHRVVRISSGEVRIVHEKCEHFRNEEGQIIRSIGMVHDITERKQAEEQLKEYAERLERSNRELEQFAFMASHDLQEPLRKIEMFGDLLLERATGLNDRERNYLDRMRSAAGRMRDMVAGLLQLSRVNTQGRPFVTVDLSQVTSEALAEMEETIHRVGGKVSYSNLPVVEGDPVQLRQLMQNLIGNALKYHQPDAPPDVKIYAKQLSGKAKIFVEDKGIGFEQEDAERIFQPFQRLVGRSQYEGSGIGLAICRRIIERHDGNITVLSKPGHGTTFVLTLPVTYPECAKNDLRKDGDNETTGTSPGG